MKSRKELVGYCAVDSGQIMLVDPCYVLNNDTTDEEYDRVCREHTEKVNEITFSGVAGSGVVTETGYGDGNYPVYAEIADEGKWGERVKSITIKFF